MSGDGYTPVFATVFDGSLCGKWPDSAVWLTMLALCDKRGNVDMSYQAIAGRTGWPPDLLRQGIAALTQPDPESRSPAEQGRRLIPLDPQRGWGWHVVNHGAYREKARLMAQSAAQVEDGRNADKCRRYREKLAAVTHDDTARHPVTPGDTLSDSNANADSNAEKNPPRKTSVGTRGKRATSASTEMPLDFALDDAMRAQALSRASDCDVDAAFESFRAHHQARASRFKNWRAAWVTWIGNFGEFGYPKIQSKTETTRLKAKYPGYEF